MKTVDETNIFLALSGDIPGCGYDLAADIKELLKSKGIESTYINWELVKFEKMKMKEQLGYEPEMHVLRIYYPKK